MSDTPLNKILYSKPSITKLEVQYAADAAENGWGEQCYDYIMRFEEAFKAHLGVQYAISTSSCTGALHMGMHALGIGPGDEVILADTNWIATAAPIVHLGATPVFVDILPDSWCLDPEQVKAAITPNTKAIVAVHIYGNLCEMDALIEIGQNHGIPVIEDAAEALGSVYRGKQAGSIGHFGVFSFHGTKTLTTGEGGMFVTDDKDLYERVLTLSNHGRAHTQRKHFWPEMVGYKYKMSNIQAAIGCAQVERINTLIEEKRSIFNMYKCALSGFPLAMNPEPLDCTNSYWMPTIVLKDTLLKQSLVEAMKNSNIDARPFFWPLSDFNIPRATTTDKLSLSRSIASRALNLPSPFGLSIDSVAYISSLIAKVLVLSPEK